MPNRKPVAKSLCVLLVALVLAAPLLRAQIERLTPDQIELVNKKWPGAKKTSTGIRYIIQKEGDGESPKQGDTVGVCYIGTLLDGKKFDEHLDRDQPLAFRVGRGEVIPGWDQILPAMKLHEKRLVIIPSDLAYGSRGRAPDIPRDAVLVFEMELISIKHPE
ncbi:MAG TPA: FKBP-type peptidyl-prolyl cis-trans isomerase [Opitutus sp.]|nr:FKBP-type peptidyl-prolyl cis-trans isomerase [Opitutus sp.]